MDLADRTWFVSYDVTSSRIVLQHIGDDEHQITADEAEALGADLRAALVAEYEHRLLRAEGETA